MSAVTDVQVAHQSLTSQTGFATIDTEAVPDRTRPTMAWQIDGMTGRPVARWVIRLQPAMPRPAPTNAQAPGLFVSRHVASACTWLSEDQQAT